MPRSIYINLAVKDGKLLSQSLLLDHSLTPTSTCIVFSETINVMIMTHDKFKGFIPPSKEVADAAKVTEALFCIWVEKKEEVDAMVEAAENSGGKKDPTKLPEMPGMHCRSLEDLDGHIWELGFMDIEACKAHWGAAGENG
jgi:predicted lactoylglutathione lyase